MSVRLVKGLYASPRRRPTRPSGGLNLNHLVHEAMQVSKFHALFSQPTDVVELARSVALRRGWSLPRAEIVEALEEIV